MKRKLALFMVLALLVSLVPANVFAASGNSIDKIPSVATDHEFTTDAPNLRIEEKEDGEFGITTQTFQLILDNADWNTDAAADMVADVITDDAAVVLDITRLSDTRLQVELSFTDATEDNFIKLPLYVTVDEEGKATVEVKGMDSAVTSGTYTFANVSDGNTTTTIEDTTTFGDTTEMETITIEENVIGTFGEPTEINIKMTDSDFDWVDSAATITLSGGFDSTATVVQDFDDNILTLTIADIYDGTPTSRGIITIEGLEVDPSSDADFGDISVKIYGDDVTTETFEIGTYSDYEVTVEGDDPVTIYAGDMDGATEAEYADEEKDMADFDEDAEVNELAVLTIEEEISKSWLVERTTRITFPDWVKIIAVEIDDSSNLTVDVDDIDFTPGDNEIEFGGWEKTNNANTTSIDLIFFVSVEADAEGDIVAEVSGSSLEQDTEVTLGKAVAKVEIDVEVADVRLGVQDQEVGKIVIEEVDEEMLASGETITLILDAEVDWASTPDVEVTEGDLTIDDVEKNGNVITITIDDESTEASTIEITGMEVDVDRTVAEGNFNITIGGTALVKNYDEDDDDYFFDTDSIFDDVFVRVITPADPNVQAGETVTFTIDSREYKIGDTVITMDVAAFIDASNRTMLPLRAFANALGVTDENILWNGTERSVTIFKGDRVVKIIIDQMSFMINGVTVPMDTQAVIKDSRTFLPVRALGQALGGQIGWDAATRTVTID